VVKDNERESALAKYEWALKFRNKMPMIDTDIYCDTWAVISLRNALVHFKPPWDLRRPQPNFISVLSGRYNLSAFIGSQDNFVTMRTMSGGCMEWVIATAMKFLREFDKRARLHDQKMSQFWQFESH
jgi:hypothetical protein